MNKVKGKVILKGSGVGIPNILINVYNIDRQAMPTEILSRSGAETHPTLSLERLQGASRLGSVLTNRTGEFELAYEDSKFTSGNRENRPYILVLVTGPEEPGIQPCPPILHISCDIRQSAGRTETYLIQLSEEQLQKAGVPVPMTEPEEAEKIVKRLADAEERRLKIDHGIREIQRKRIEKLRKRYVDFTNNIKPKLIETVSHVSRDLRESETFVAEGQSVKERTFSVIKDGLKVINNPLHDPYIRPPVKSYISLTPSQIRDLKKLRREDGSSYLDSDGNFVDVPADKVHQILYQNMDGDEEAWALNGTDLLRDDPLNSALIKPLMMYAQKRRKLGV